MCTRRPSGVISSGVEPHTASPSANFQLFLFSCLQSQIGRAYLLPPIGMVATPPL